MNDKIKELAEQAASAVREQHNNAYWRIQDETAEDSAWREKFAELIVRDCIEIVEASKAGFSQVPAEVALDLTAKNIKAYFGLK